MSRFGFCLQQNYNVTPRLFSRVNYATLSYQGFWRSVSWSNGRSFLRAKPAELSKATLHRDSGLVSGVHGIGRGFSMLIQFLIIRLLMLIIKRNESTSFATTPLLIQTVPLDLYQFTNNLVAETGRWVAHIHRIIDTFAGVDPQLLARQLVLIDKKWSVSPQTGAHPTNLRIIHHIC